MQRHLQASPTCSVTGNHPLVSHLPAPRPCLPCTARWCWAASTHQPHLQSHKQPRSPPRFPAPPHCRLVLGDIILNINGKRINSASDLYRILDKSAVGDKVLWVLQVLPLVGCAAACLYRILDKSAGGTRWAYCKCTAGGMYFHIGAPASRFCLTRPRCMPSETLHAFAWPLLPPAAGY